MIVPADMQIGDMISRDDPTEVWPPRPATLAGEAVKWADGEATVFKCEDIETEPWSPVHAITRGFMMRARQAGKSLEMGQMASKASGLSVETCVELLQAGYHFTAYRDAPNEWKQGW